MLTGWERCCSDYLTNSIVRTQDEKAEGDRMKVCTMINTGKKKAQIETGM